MSFPAGPTQQTFAQRNFSRESSTRRVELLWVGSSRFFATLVRSIPGGHSLDSIAGNRVAPSAETDSQFRPGVAA